MKTNIFLATALLLSVGNATPIWAKDRCQLSNSAAKTACAKNAVAAKTAMTRPGRSEAEVYADQMPAPAGH